MAAQTVGTRPLGALGRMSIVIAMHVGLVFLLAGGLVMRKAEEPPNIQSTFIDEPQPPIDVPPVTQPTELERPDVYVPQPLFDPLEDPPLVESTIIAQALPPDGVEVGPGSAVPVPTLVNVRQDARHPLSQPPYPATDIRLGNEGSADVEVYVLPNGRVGDARIVKSTGFERMDRATLEEARRNWRLIPATRDGVAVPQWYRLRVVFKLTNQ
jgi:protein TonB